MIETLRTISCHSESVRNNSKYILTRYEDEGYVSYDVLEKSSHALSGYDRSSRSFDTFEQANEYLNKMINFWTSQGGKVYKVYEH